MMPVRKWRKIEAKLRCLSLTCIGWVCLAARKEVRKRRVSQSVVAICASHGGIPAFMIVVGKFVATNGIYFPFSQVETGS